MKRLQMQLIINIKSFYTKNELTHCGHIAFKVLVNMGNGLWPYFRQAITWAVEPMLADFCYQWVSQEQTSVKFECIIKIFF